MNIADSSVTLRKLAENNANYLISFEQYRNDRKLILDALDNDYNAVKPVQQEITVQEAPEGAASDITNEADKTQPYFANKLGKCMNFFKGSSNR